MLACAHSSPRRFNVEPDALPDLIFASVGRCVWRDIGGVAVAFRLMMKLIVRAWQPCLRLRVHRTERTLLAVQDFNLMSTLTAYCAPLMADFKKNL